MSCAVVLITTHASFSAVSLFSSSIILFMIFRGGGIRLKKIHNRLLFCMSIFDVLQSVATGLSTIPTIPTSNQNNSGDLLSSFVALGNYGSCTAQGFFVQLGLVVPSYSAMLCIYYMCVIKYNMREEKVKKYEPFMHAFAILPTLIIAVIALCNSLFNNYSTMCWINDSGDNTDSNYLLLILHGFVLALLFIIFLITTISMTAVVLTVRERELRMQQYSFQRRTNAGRRVANSNLSKTTTDTKKQSFIYVAGFTMTYISMAIVLIMDSFLGRRIPFFLLLLQSIFLPLQGFWNFLAYIRPRFSMMSTDHPEKSWFQKLFMTILKKPDIPDRSRSRHKSSLRSGKRGSKRRKRRRDRREIPTTAETKTVHFPLNDLRTSNEEKAEISLPDIRSNSDLERGMHLMFGSCATPRSTNPDGHNPLRESTEGDNDDEIYHRQEHPSLSSLVAQDMYSSSNFGRRRRSMLDKSFTTEALLTHQENFCCGSSEAVQSNQENFGSGISSIILNSTEKGETHDVESNSGGCPSSSTIDRESQRSQRRHSCPSLSGF